MSKIQSRVKRRNNFSIDKERETLRDIAEGHFIFRPDMHISDKSRYVNSSWDWYDPTNPRLQTYNPSDLIIDWDELQKRLNLPDLIIADFKKYSVLRYLYSRQVFPVSQKNIHPSTLVGEVRTLSRFISHIREQLSGDDYCLVNDLSDIELQDLKDGLSTYQGPQERLRSALKYLGSAALSQYLDCGPLKWTTADVEILEWDIKEKQPYERLPEGMFRHLSNAATADVKRFLLALGIEPEDKTKIGDGENIYISAFSNFKQLFKGYVVARNALKDDRWGDGVHSYNSWRVSLGHSIQPLADLIDRARSAAQTIITSYTAGRLSELVGFKLKSCLRKKGDHYVLVGTVIKHKSVNAPVDKDEWITIPIVRDAVRVLKETGRIVAATFLFHGSNAHPSLHRPMSGGKLSKVLTDYLRLVDAQGNWKEEKISAQRFRNSLAFELRKAGLGIDFITFQLKHFYYAMGDRINNTTLSYGSIGKGESLKAIKDANYEAVQQVFHPDAPVAGGGAEQFKKRRAAYFQGAVEAGKEVEDILRKLAEQAQLYSDVGIALCLGQNKVVVDGVKKDPPCIGQLRCNPVRCSNGIIPLTKLSVWEQVEKENRKHAQDPQLAYAKTHFEEAADEADAVVTFLKSQNVRRSKRP